MWSCPTPPHFPPSPNYWQASRGPSETPIERGWHEPVKVTLQQCHYYNQRYCQGSFHVRSYLPSRSRISRAELTLSGRSRDSIPMPALFLSLRDVRLSN